MASSNDIYVQIAEINLWFKLRTGDELKLSDVQSIVPLRWAYLRDNWEFIKDNVLTQKDAFIDPDFLNTQISEFSDFIEAQRTSGSKINPLSGDTVFHRFFAIFDNIAIESINLTNEESRLVQAQRDKVNAFTKNDFLYRRKSIRDYRDQLADTYSLTDGDYNTIFGRSAVPAQLNATITDLNMLNTLQSTIKSIDFILANLFTVDAAIDPFALARANANNPDIDIGQYKTGYLVRMNYGDTLESLADRYLGDANKWIDIAIANGLKSPYIDEVGIRIPLLANGNGHQINISETDINGIENINRLYINQPIILQSDTQVSPDQRTIVNIKQIPVSGEIILELDGEDDLNVYQIADNANIRVYLPNTVNSSFYVLIPSTESLSNPRTEETPWFLTKSSADEKRAGIDLAISDDGDLILTSNGDLRLSYGVDNAIQAIKLKMVTELGSLTYHPDFGLINVIGNINSDINGTKASIIESIRGQIETDSRFDRIENISVDYLVNNVTNEGVAAIAISLSVKMAGSDRIIPISFTVNNS
jgi:hypothetical protein